MKRFTVEIKYDDGAIETEQTDSIAEHWERAQIASKWDRIDLYRVSLICPPMR